MRSTVTAQSNLLFDQMDLSDDDVLFGDRSRLPDNELDACLVYELARESKTIRRVFQAGWHLETNVQTLPDDAPPFLGKGVTARTYLDVLDRLKQGSANDVAEQSFWAHSNWKTFKELWMPLLKWNAFDDYVSGIGDEIREARRKRIQPAWANLSPCERETFNDLVSSVSWRSSKSEIPPAAPYFLTTPFLGLDQGGRSAKRPDAFRPAFSRDSAWPQPVASDSRITSYEGEYVSLFIHWRGRSVEDLAQEFTKWATSAEGCPKQFHDDLLRKRNAGHNPSREMLKKLARCRLFAQFKNKNDLPPQWRRVFESRPARVVQDCMELDVYFRERFAFLSADESPICFVVSRTKGRFDKKRGRPRKIDISRNQICAV